MKCVVEVTVLALKLLIYLSVFCDAEPQFRTDQNRERYEDPFLRPATSNPNNRYPNDANNRYRRPDWTDRYKGEQYRHNFRGGASYGSRDSDRLRLNFNQQQKDDFEDYTLKNTIYDRWRPDLQGEERPGVTPGINYPLSENVLVSTDTGTIQGFYVYMYDKPGIRPEEWPVNKPLDLQRPLLNVTVFLGIPYAQKPVNEGRFKPPRRVRNWHTTWQAIDYSPACPQNLKYVGATMGIRNGIDEDCLYLNVFTPTLSVNARERYPVMFYIHGGDFDHGSGSQFPGHMLSAWGEVVVVTFNYRLGALGFLSTGDYHSPGNYGLMDMAMALEWVYNNVRFFNGDRERITVFGPGAGGAAAGLLAVLPKTMDYVKQVLAESGSPLADWAAINDPYRVQNTSRVFGLEMGCNVENSYNLLNCLVKRDYEELATAPIIPDVGFFPWSPVVDGNFSVAEDNWYEEWDEADWHILPELPIYLYKRNHHHPHLRYLTGVNRDEAANIIHDDLTLSKNNYVVTEDYFNARIRDWVLHYNYTLNPNGAYDAIKWMYTFWPDPQNTTHIREQYIHMLSDALYKSGVDQIVKVLINSTEKRSVPTYNYVLNTTVEALKLPLWREVPNNIEMYFITGAPFMDPEFYPETVRVSRHSWTEGDRNISQFMMKSFANFAKWGNPTQEQVAPIQMNWEMTVEGELKYLSINNTFNTSMFYNYRQQQETFWYQYMPQVVKEYIPIPVPPRNPWLDMKEPVTATMYGLLVVVVAFFVVLCVCCGMWKSAKTQRNKALDDLSYYSTENLTLAKDEDYDVQNYLEKVRSLSRTGTINTMMSNDVTQNSRPITPSTGLNGTNGGTLPMGENQQYRQRSQARSLNSQNGQESNSKPYIMELEEPSRVIRGHNFDSSSLTTDLQYIQPHLAGNQQQFASHQFVNNSHQPQYSTIQHHQYQPNNLNIQQFTNNQQYPINQQQPLMNNQFVNNQQPLMNNQFVNNQQPFTKKALDIADVPPSAENSQHSSLVSANLPVSANNTAQPTNQITDFTSLNGHSSASPVQLDRQSPPQNEAPSKPLSSELQEPPKEEGAPTARPLTPNSVTFGFSMKPAGAKSVGTISATSGLILNTDL